MELVQEMCHGWPVAFVACFADPCKNVHLETPRQLAASEANAACAGKHYGSKSVSRITMEVRNNVSDVVLKARNLSAIGMTATATR